MKRESKNIWLGGFTLGAENWNGRLAMLGFLLIFIIETITGKGILSFLGLTK
uniref:CAB/ELIP/HLIP superfamily protein n=1 Tax=Glaucosphaera vacuolata TaxID=38265 RepID=UPI001FCDCAC4|nr:CAB/ELIP/HLIP superfamily protein [Glaucosphaera vacuolata]UNJ18625.1 CAB/ELIP/HLIP superfamily protein [Glaucosphaera vacuolata]